MISPSSSVAEKKLFPDGILLFAHGSSSVVNTTNNWWELWRERFPDKVWKITSKRDDPDFIRQSSWSGGAEFVKSFIEANRSAPVRSNCNCQTKKCQRHCD